MNVNLLRSKIALTGHRDSDLANIIGVSSAAVSSRMNGNTEFSRLDISKIIKRYGLTTEETHKIFFEE
jgi:antitoxin component HigA of HigAB toxin-antitoxin module